MLTNESNCGEAVQSNVGRFLTRFVPVVSEVVSGVVYIWNGIEVAIAVRKKRKMA